MKIRVTQEHINEGVPGKACSCPIALALNDQINPPHHIQVGSEVILISSALDTCAYGLPEKVKQFISDFDGELFVEPLEFELNIEN